MSAFIVPREHIDVLVMLALEGPTGAHRWRTHGPLRWVHGERIVGLVEENADAVGRMLWRENVRSVAYRYPDDADGHRPGPVGFRDSDAEAYGYQDPRCSITLAEGIHAIAGYEYQACEHPEWHGCEAAAFCEALRVALCYHIPGGDKAPWVWNAEDVRQRQGGPISILRMIR